jgi:hypothetical protein
LDANVNFKLAALGEVFLSIDNIANKAAAQVAYGTNAAELRVMWSDLESKFRIATRAMLTSERQDAVLNAIGCLQAGDLRPLRAAIGAAAAAGDRGGSDG